MAPSNLALTPGYSILALSSKYNIPALSKDFNKMAPYSNYQFTEYVISNNKIQ